MNKQVMKVLTTKYTQKEITIAVRVLRDVLKVPAKPQKRVVKNAGVFASVDMAKELSIKEIAQLKRQEKDRLSRKAKYISANKVWDELGV